MTTSSTNYRMKSSVRSVPRENFNKYLQMFNHSSNNMSHAINNSNKKKASIQQTNLIYEEVNNTGSHHQLDENSNESDDQNHGHNDLILLQETSENCNNEYVRPTNVKLNRMFYGISDETHCVLNSLCNVNEEIASFFVETPCVVEEKKVPIRRCAEECEWYSAIPITTMQSDNYVELEINNSNNRNYDDSSLIESFPGSLDGGRRRGRDEDSSESAINHHESQFNRLILNPSDFSDDSFDENEIYAHEGFEVKLSILKIQDADDEKSIETSDDSSAPPKPLRTFEHDIYIQNKNFLTLENKIFNKNNMSNEITNNTTNDIIKRHSLTNNAERRILKLIESNNNNDHIYETLPAIRSKENENPYAVLHRKNLNSTQDPKYKTNNNRVSGKIFSSEPNLTTFFDPTKLANKNSNTTLKPFGRFFNQLKMTLSRKSINSDEPTPVSLSLEPAPAITRSIGYREKTKNLNNNEIFNKMIQFNSYSRVKSHIYTDVSEVVTKTKKTLFDYVLVVGIKDRKSQSTQDINSNKTNPIILWHFPENIQGLNPSITQFCFPDTACQNEYKKTGSEIFQFTLTNFEGSRTYGYCIRLLNKKTPLVICIVSQADALEMYQMLLIETAQLYATSAEDAKLFLSALYSKPLPKRGESISVTFGLEDKKEIILNRSYDRRLEHINLFVILNFSIDLIIRIFSSMLAEKKIIFLSSKLSLLSNTIQAFETLLYPFGWPHTFIPVLPSYMYEMCEAPTPYIIGLLRTNIKLLTKYKSEKDMLIVDLDKKKCMQDIQITDERDSFRMPEKIVNILKNDLINLTRISKFKSESEKNVDLCLVFLNFFIKSIGSYRDYIEPRDTNVYGEISYKFLKKEFVMSSGCSEVNKFLEWFTRTQLFDVFITKKLNPNLKFGLMFDNAIREEKSALQESTDSSKSKESSSPKSRKIKPFTRILSNVYKF